MLILVGFLRVNIIIYNLKNYKIKGSMPPFSRSLQEEGVSIKSFKLVKNGIFQEEGNINY